MTQSGNKLAVRLGDSEIAEALVTAGLKNPVAIEQASDAAIEDAVGSENLATVRSAFPAEQS